MEELSMSDNNLKKLMFIFGTRPEFIKVFPVIQEAKRRGNPLVIVNTGQHKEMLNDLLDYFKVEIDYDLKIMDHNSGLANIVASSIIGLDPIVKQEKPDLILVHGDTAATLAGGLVAYFNQIQLAHIEAGLRTYNKYSPFPEEMNRQMVGVLADFHFAPTELTRQNLLKEGKKEEIIFVVGNSAIDMFQYTLKDDYSHEVLSWQADKEMILITAHRRENLSEMEEIFEGIAEIADEFSETHKIIYPIHLNPAIREKAQKLLSHPNIKIIEPLDTVNFHNVMQHTKLILTDSGGIQEEAAQLGIPVLVMRDTTERPEGVEAGTLKLVGTKKENIVKETRKLLTDQKAYERMTESKNPYGDGTTSVQIMNIINEHQKKL